MQSQEKLAALPSTNYVLQLQEIKVTNAGTKKSHF